MQRNLRVIGHTDLNGRGDGGQVMIRTVAGQSDVTRIAYVAHMGDSGTALSIVDVSDLTAPRVLHQVPVPNGATHCHKVMLMGNLLLMNLEVFGSGQGHEAGVALFSLDDPTRPVRIGTHVMEGVGAHRMWLDGTILHVAGRCLSDGRNPIGLWIWQPR